MTIENTVKVGDFLTALSVSIAIVGLFIASLRDRRLRRKEYADRIRQSAAATAVAVERWTELAVRLYDDIQALITDADMLLVEKQDVITARNFFWRGLVEARATASRRILDEKLDSAYVGLYGYAPDIQGLYTSVMRSLKHADEIAYTHLLEETQREVMNCSDRRKPYTSAELGNRLRSKASDANEELVLAASSIVTAFRSRMLSLINATDGQIFNKTFSEFAAAPNPYVGSQA
jgi:hypothetical protein